MAPTTRTRTEPRGTCPSFLWFEGCQSFKNGHIPGKPISRKSIIPGKPISGNQFPGNQFWINLEYCTAANERNRSSAVGVHVQVLKSILQDAFPAGNFPGIHFPGIQFPGNTHVSKWADQARSLATAYSEYCSKSDPWYPTPSDPLPRGIIHQTKPTPWVMTWVKRWNI